MGIFYKAVQQNGTDFYSGRVDYASLCGTDQTLPPLPKVNGRYGHDGPRCCTGDVYHASVAKADTLIGGSWPCRLFEVEGEPVAEEDTKRGFYTLKVVRELPAHEALGPSGVALLALFAEIESLTWEQAERAPIQWESSAPDDAGVMELVSDNARYQAQDSDRGAALDVVEPYVSGLVLTRLPYSTSHMTKDVTIRGRARFAAKMAARALVVKDMVDDYDFTLLTAPWNKVMGRAG